jgi:chromate transporter
MLGYGGGPSIVPIYKHEVVNNFQWMNAEEFGNAVAFGNSLPGPIATKLAAYIGFKVCGFAGAITAIIAVVLPTAFLMIALFSIMSKFQNNVFVNGMIKGIQPVIFVMFAMLAYEFSKYAFGTLDSKSAINFIPFIIASIYFIMVQYLSINPVWGIVGALIAGALFIR